MAQAREGSHFVIFNTYFFKKLTDPKSQSGLVGNRIPQSDDKIIDRGIRFSFCSDNLALNKTNVEVCTRLELKNSGGIIGEMRKKGAGEGDTR